MRDLDIVHQMEISLIENLQREDLNPIEAAKGVRMLMQQCGYTQEKVSLRLGKSRPAVANLLRLLSLPDEVMEMVQDGRISAGHARVLAGLQNREEQIALALQVVEQGMSVRELETLAAKPRNPQGKTTAKRRCLPPELGELQEKILERTGMKCTLSGSVQKGRIVLQYTTREELEHFNDVLDLL